MKTRHKKLLLVAVAVLGLGAVAALVLNAFRSNLVFFFSPTQVVKGEAPRDRAFRIGGLVETASLSREADGITAHFRVTDTANTIAVTYKGVLPDLFKEGKGVVAEGRLGDSGIFMAEQVLAKHDENYMPPEAASALEQAEKSKKTLVLPQGKQ
ncbi:MAG: cytochrome c maturation protein CcmE [Betaproteobacteria bacterium]|nr:cytochrome c maturation protein CcmE [Betaproteobacteria bacterium]